jgi:acetyl-CoA acetyltransferase
MSRAPFVTPKAEKPFERGDRPCYDTTLGWRFTNPKLVELFPPESMGETGENVAERWGVSGRIRTRSRSSRSGAGPRPTRRAASPTSWSRSAT